MDFIISYLFHIYHSIIMIDKNRLYGSLWSFLWEIWKQFLLTIFVVGLDHLELFAGPGRALKGSQGPPHDLHLCFHGGQGGKDFFHALCVLQRLITLEKLLYIRLLLPGCSCSFSMTGVPLSLPPSLPDGQRLDHRGRGSLEVVRTGEQV